MGALAHSQRAAQLASANAQVYQLMGDACARLERWLEAIKCYQRAIEIDPAHADAYNNLGIALSSQARRPEAIQAYAQAISLQPAHAHAFFNLGKESVLLGDPEGAAVFFQRAIALNPAHAYAWHELGALDQAAGLLDQAVGSYRRSIELDPTPPVRANLAALLALLGDPLGLTQLQALVDEQPDSAEAHWHWAMGLLLHRHFQQGWQQFEWRTKIERLRRHHERFDQPRWQGQSLAGETILLYGEQGHGDTLQFLRYLPLVIARGARVVLEVQPLLKRLLQGLPGVDACLAYGEARPVFHWHAALMSLPHLLGETEIPPPLAPVAPSFPKQRIDATPRPQSGLQVGLVWSGNSVYKRDRLRSIPLSQWTALAAVEGVQFTSLQVSDAATGPASSNSGRLFQFVADCQGVEDFADTAHILAGLDLVITVDTAVAHLAGSMGKHVWILLSNAVDWRWGLRGEETEWYPTARLFRQTTPGSWAETLEAVAEALRRLIRAR
jgi:Flp pilus assembly protein TadD